MLKKILEMYSKKLYSGCVILIANVYGRTSIISNDKLRIQAEFFNEAELNYIVTSLKKCGYNIACYFDENVFINDYLNGEIEKTYKEYIVFNLARNGYGIGKKSLIPTFCDLNGIKYTSSNGYACSFARHKYHVNALLNYLNMNSLESYVFSNGCWSNNSFPLPSSKKYIIKPLSESASQGIKANCIFNNNLGNIDDFVRLKYLELNSIPLLIQEFIEGFEAKTTIIEFDKPYSLEPIGVEINGQHDLKDAIISEEIAFNYAHQNYLLKDELDEATVSQIKKQSLIIYNAIGMQNYGRIDCRIDNKTGKVYYMDFSTMPYFVSEGEMLFAFEKEGYDICGLMNCIINSSLVSKYNYSL